MNDDNQNAFDETNPTGVNLDQSHYRDLPEDDKNFILAERAR